MDTVEFSRYIPVGCLVLNQKDSKIPDQLWHLPDLNHWHHFSTANGQHSANNDPASPPLPVNIQDLLLASDALAPYANLLLHQWIQLAFSVCLDEPAQGIVRVYLLPDDIGNRAVSRQNNSLRKARLDLLGRLDLSNSTWHGEAGPNPSANPSSLSSAEEAVDDGTDKEETLLEMFNNIPSPNPRPDTVEDPYTRDAMENLLESDVPGLSTTLFPYQRRSAALMLQREEQMQKVMDPRLLKSVDREGKEWYYDAYAGVALREPRYYDEPRGGILAEEMGAGKTLISLALILATKHIPAAIPDIYRGPLVRAKVASLADMAAACITRNGVPWKSEFAHDEFPFSNCIEVIRRNPGCYAIPRPQERRALRNEAAKVSSLKIYLSHASLIIVPPNLVQQWQQEITKHTNGLKVLVVVENRQLPPVEQLLELDIILFSSTRFERFLVDPFRIERYRQGGSTWVSESPLLQIHFKRCIVDEGHRLGNSTTSNKSNLHLLIDALQITARWIVTGTPSKGLYGIDNTGVSDGDRNARLTAESSGDLEKDDLKRIGSIAAHYLKMRPWANTHAESGDTPAEWSAYVMQPKHSRESHGRKDCLKKTLESLIIRHPLSEMSKFLPTVDEKLVYLEGSYFDSLVLNIFSMNIIFNSVQSQRTDQDYFFHPKSRKALMQLVSNLRQASFFGGVFYRPTDILQSVNRAVDFLAKGKVQISPEDDALLRNAIEFGQVVLANSLKECSNLFQDIPLYVAGFPWGAGQVWSLNLQGDREIVTTSRLMHALQKLLQPIVDAPESLELLFQSGSFEAHGEDERSSCLEAQTSITGSGSSKTKVNKLAGDTRPGQDDASQSKRRTAILKMPFHMRENASAAPDKTPETKIAEPLSAAMLIATASAKLSYLIDQIVKYQGEEQIIVFYENDNVAYYLAEALEMLQIQHLIYARGLTPERRAQYASTFNQTSKFRVMLMDISQAAFGLDMQSASRIYFVNPVLNPQIEAQAIGRARRISQQKPVTVETLILRGSLEEVIMKRRAEMTQAQQRKCHDILDDKPIYEWIANAKILPLPKGANGTELISPADQMAKLETPQFIFGRGFGRKEHPDQDLVDPNNSEGSSGIPPSASATTKASLKRRKNSPQGVSQAVNTSPDTPGAAASSAGDDSGNEPVAKRPRPRVRFAEADTDD